MRIGRNVIADLEAVAAVPGLEELAATLRSLDPRPRPRVDYLALCLLLAGRWICGSLNEFESLLCTTDVWEWMCRSAARVGRELPERPATADQLRHFRDNAVEAYGEQALSAVTAFGVQICALTGLLPDDVEPEWDQPRRANTVTADGTVFDVLSEVEVDPETGEVRGSRNTGFNGARVAERFQGKNNLAPKGFPVAFATIHSGVHWSWVIVGTRGYFDGNETGASVQMVTDLVQTAPGRVHHVVYDRLMGSRQMTNLMRLGVLPIVEMKSARGARHLELPQDMWIYKGNPDRPGRTKKGNKKKTLVKKKVHLAFVDVVPCDSYGGPDHHELWAIDGVLVTVAAGEKPSLDAAVVERRRLERVELPDGRYGFVSDYRVPCSAHGHRYEVHHHRNRTKSSTALTEDLRPLSEWTTEGKTALGWRQDSESNMATVKACNPIYGRASALTVQDFLLDLMDPSMAVGQVVGRHRLVVERSTGHPSPPPGGPGRTQNATLDNQPNADGASAIQAAVRTSQTCRTAPPGRRGGREGVSSSKPGAS